MTCRPLCVTMELKGLDVQTFLPYEDYERSAKCLDQLRLGKQIMEAGQILRALTVPEYGWKSHPATKMWAGYEPQLYLYAMDMSVEWYDRRGKVHGATTRIMKEFGGALATIKPITLDGDGPKPPWMGGYIHVTHQSNLLRKDPEHYGQFYWEVPDDLEYFWPVADPVIIG